MYDLPIKEFIHHVQAWYEAFPQMVLDRPGLLEPFLPTLRADMRLLETHEWTSGPPMDCPITALGGLQDRAVPVASLRAWQQHTSAALRVRVFMGGHFYVRDQSADIIDAVRQGLIQP